MALKIVFAGTPEFAIPALTALCKSAHEIVAVYTKPDSPTGRGQKLTASPVKKFAEQQNLPIYQPQTLKDQNAQQTLHDFDADIMVDAAYGLYLPKTVLEMFPYGCVNIHPSLLPRWRGAAPIQRAILAGDPATGVTIMQVDAGWDTGPIFYQEKIKITATDTTATLTQTLAASGATLLIEILAKLETKQITSTPQQWPHTYADKITKQEAQLNWQLSAIELDRMIRAFNPWPIAFSEIDGQTIRIWAAILRANIGRPQGSPLQIPGTIIKSDKKSIDVITGNGILRLLKLQLPGGKILTIGEILNSKPEMFAIGKKFHA